MTYPLTNGEFVELTLNYGKLYRVRTKYRTAYDAYMNVYKKLSQRSTSDDNIDYFFDPLTIIYTAYLCGIAEGETPYTFEEFLDVVPEDMTGNVEIMGELINPKKKIASAEHS